MNEEGTGAPLFTDTASTDAAAVMQPQNPERISEPEESDLDRVAKMLRSLGWMKRRKSRIREHMQARINSLDRQIEWVTAKIEMEALAYRMETGLTEMPVESGTVKIRKRPPTAILNEVRFDEWARGAGLEGNPQFQTRKWDMPAIRKEIAWTKPDGSGLRVAMWKDTGEPVEGMTKQAAGDGEFSVSIKPGKVTTLADFEEEED